MFKLSSPFKFVEAVNVLETQPKWDREGDGTTMCHLDRRQRAPMEVSMYGTDGTYSIVDLQSGGIDVEVDRGSERVATGVTRQRGRPMKQSKMGSWDVDAISVSVGNLRKKMMKNVEKLSSVMEQLL